MFWKAPWSDPSLLISALNIRSWVLLPKIQSLYSGDQHLTQSLHQLIRATPSPGHRPPLVQAQQQDIYEQMSARTVSMRNNALLKQTHCSRWKPAEPSVLHFSNPTACGRQLPNHSKAHNFLILAVWGPRN